MERFARCCSRHLIAFSEATLYCLRCRIRARAWVVIDVVTGAVVAAGREVPVGDLLAGLRAVWLRPGLTTLGLPSARRLGVPRPPLPRAA